MSAILRPAKFLRIVSGFARSQQAQPLPNYGPNSSLLGKPSASGPGSAGSASASQENQLIVGHWDGTSPFQAWSLQYLQSALPVTASHKDDDQTIGNEEGVLPPHKVTKKEIETLLESIPVLDGPLKQSHSVLVLRMCGQQLKEDVPNQSERIDFVHKVWTKLEEDFKVEMKVEHYNALLSVYLELDHQFCPDHIHKRLKKNNIKPNQETLEAFMERFCKDSDMEKSSVEKTDKKALEVKPTVTAKQEQEAATPQPTPEPKMDLLQGPEPSSSPAFPEGQRFTAVAMVQVFDAASQTFQYCPLPIVLQTFQGQGRFWDLEQLLDTSQGSFTQDDRRSIYLATLQTYMAHGLYDKAITLTARLETEGLAFNFPSYHTLMSQFAESFAFHSASPASIAPAFSSGVPSTSATPYPPSEVSSYPPTPASEAEEQLALQAMYHKALKKSLNDKNSDSALKAYLELKKTGKPLNVTESSSLIELLVKGSHVKEAAELTESMLKKDTYPMPKIFRFLLNKLAANGEVDLMNSIGKYLSSKVKKEVSFDNRLCNAYLSAGQANEFLDILDKEVDNLRPENVQSVKDKFPRGGAMGILENNPHLIEKYAKVAAKFVKLDYIAPMNVLWTYYFINNMHDKAEPLWQLYVKDCPQIMFQKICQTARSQGNLDMASRLVDLLKDAKVTSGAQGIAYSCLLDVMTQKGSFKDALDRLESGLEQGVNMDDINRTAIIRLKSGLEDQGLDFPFEVPKKNKIALSAQQ